MSLASQLKAAANQAHNSSYCEQELKALIPLLNPVLVAAGFSAIEGRLSRVEFNFDRYELTYNWRPLSRGEWTSVVTIPASVVEADDPVASASLWRKDEHVKHAREHLRRCRAALASAEAELERALAHKESSVKEEPK